MVTLHVLSSKGCSIRDTFEGSAGGWLLYFAGMDCSTFSSFSRDRYWIGGECEFRSTTILPALNEEEEEVILWILFDVVLRLLN